MIVARYLIKETLQVLVAVTGVLLLIFLGRHFARFLADAASGRIPAEIVLQLLGTLTISSLVLLLPISFYIAILVSFGRMYKDSEITAMSACGIGTSHLIRIMLGLVLGFGVLVAGLSLYISPWSVEQGLKIRDMAGARNELLGISAGKFQEFAGGQGVFYVQDISGTGSKEKMHNVFVYAAGNEKMQIYSANAGRQLVDDTSGDRFMELQQGFRYESTPGGNDFQIHSYETSAVRIEPKEVGEGFRNVDARSSEELWNSDRSADLAELHWRLSMPVSAVLMSLLAILLSRTTPRQGRYGKLFAGIVVYVFYYNLLGIGKSWLKDEVIPVQLGLWWIHALLMILIMIMFVRQYGLRYLMSRRGIA